LVLNHSLEITNLDDNQEYAFIIKSKDAENNGATSEVMFFTTAQGQYPVFSNVQVQNITDRSALITFQTDIPSTVSIGLRYNCYYGYGDCQQLDNLEDNNLTTEHSISVSGLIPHTQHFFDIYATSQDGSKSYYYGDFITLASPEIFNISVSTPNGDTARIDWETTIPMSSYYIRIWRDNCEEGGESCSFTYYISPEEETTTYSLNIDNLLPNTFYHFEIRSHSNTTQLFYYSDFYDFTTPEYVDIEPPTGSILINNDEIYTSNPQVTLNLSAQDNYSGVKEMQFSNDNISWSSWEPYATEKLWTLPAGDVLKKVYVKYRDNAGNESEAFEDSIILDTTVPTGSITINNNASTTKSLVVTLNLSATDSLSGVSLMRLSNDGTNWNSWEPYVSTKTWTLSSGKGQKYVYVQYQDKAGNISLTYSDSIKYLGK
jgi:hypothetical protein